MHPNGLAELRFGEELGLGTAGHWPGRLTLRLPCAQPDEKGPTLQRERDLKAWKPVPPRVWGRCIFSSQTRMQGETPPRVWGRRPNRTKMLPSS